MVFHHGLTRQLFFCMYHHIFLLFFSEIGDLCNSKQGEEWWTAEFCDWEPKDTIFGCLRNLFDSTYPKQHILQMSFPSSNPHFGQTDTVAKVAVCTSKRIRWVNSLIHSYFHRYEMRYWDRKFLTWKSFCGIYITDVSFGCICAALILGVS